MSEPTVHLEGDILQICLECENCGYENTAKVKGVRWVEPPAPALTIRCGLCRKEMSGFTCENCGWFREPFHRRCPHCDGAVPTDADVCTTCGKPMRVEVKGLDRVVCLGCPSRRSEQLDDWLARRNHPYLVPTPKDEKVRTLDPEKGPDYVHYFFNPNGWSIGEVKRKLLQDDIKAWEFTSQARAEEYLNQCACPDCGAHNWVLSTFEGWRQHLVGKAREHAPTVGAGAKAVLSGGITLVGGGLRLIRDAGRAAKAKQQAKGGKSGKKGRSAEAADND